MVTGSADQARDVHDQIAVVIGAEPLDASVVEGSGADGCFVIAADGGFDHAVAAGLRVDLLVGDLDSITPAGLAAVPAATPVVRHRADKDETDTELALAEAVARRPRRIVLLSGGGDRLDHQLAAIGALGAPSLAAVEHVEGWWGPTRVVTLHGPRRALLPLAPGTTFSVLALHGPVTGVSIGGARWPLHDATIAAGSGLGVSNVSSEPSVEIAAAGGVLTVVIPGAQP